jgi:hypothetical protein
MSAEFYRIVHLFGIFLLMCSLGGLAVGAWHGKGAQAGKAEADSFAKRLRMLHGVALVVIIVAGFGLMAKLGLMKTWPLWIIGKIVIWLVFGAAATFVVKGADKARAWILVLPLLGLVSAYLAIMHPG